MSSKLKVDFIVFNQDDRNGNSWVSIGYLSSNLTIHGYNTEVHFFTVDELEDALEYVLKSQPDVLGVPVLQYNFYCCIEFCKQAKCILPNTKIILGNKEANCNYAHLLSNYHECIDAISLGEGEDTLVEFCKCTVDSKPYYNCPGLALYSDGSVILTEKRRLHENLDTFPFPDRTFRIGESNVYNVLGSRGCKGNCSFCEANTIYRYNHGARVRERSIKNIIDEISELAKGHKILHINFIDSTFCGDDKKAIDRLNELYEELLRQEYEIQFGLNIRTEQINQEYVDCLKRLEKVGLVSILIGLEAGNQADLDIYNKGVLLKTHINALKILDKNEILSDKAGIHFETGFINFNPYTTLARLKENLDFFRQYNLMLLPYDMTSRLMLSRSCSLFSKVCADNLLTSNIDEPVIDPYGYRFRDSDVEKAYTLYEQYLNALKIKNYANSLARQKIYIKYFQDDITTDLYKLHRDYISLSGEIVSITIMGILENLENKYMRELWLQRIFPLCERIYEIGRKIEKIDCIMSKKLYRLGRLII